MGNGFNFPFSRSQSGRDGNKQAPRASTQTMVRETQDALRSPTHLLSRQTHPPSGPEEKNAKGTNDALAFCPFSAPQSPFLEEASPQIESLPIGIDPPSRRTRRGFAPRAAFKAAASNRLAITVGRITAVARLKGFRREIPSFSEKV